MAIRGSCLCGGVTFEIDRAVGPLELCHCNRCRKVSGSNAIAAIGVRTADYRFLTGRELVRSYSAPILYEPPAYRTTFCSNCGSPVPDPDPTGDWFEIPAGALDGDPGVKVVRHILVELVPAWDEIRDDREQLTLRELHRLRSGRDLPESFVMRTHASSSPAPRRPLGRRDDA